MENTVCLFCHGANYRVLYDGLRDLLIGAPGQFRLVICNECQLIYLNPRPTTDELGTYYPDDYEPFFRVNSKTMKPLQGWLLDYGLRKRAAPILKHKKQGRVLDIGCATGQYLAYIKSHSQWDVFGVELDKNAAEFAQQEFKLKVHVGDLASARFPDAYFDAVTMWDVLEHLPEPLETLQEIRRILSADGLLLLRVPILKSIDAQLFGRHWAGLDVPRHFHIYSRKTLFRLLGEAGFQILRHWCISGSFFSFALSLQFLVEDNFSGNKTLKRIVKLIRSVPVRLLTFPYFFIVDRLNWGPQVTVLAMKSSE